ncbi:hypothetical protein EDB82DRAFT_493562 [Fusarium venenatum]|uniref:uncharacterized protein n=1 Tax=Fusarium venenatum TaxID=56646 RepID=UPI001DAD2C1A|nr:hypothetical protein EDB82DRAFT_493562 [Fusarium venenatum]
MKPHVLILCIAQFAASETISTSFTCNAGAQITTFPACNSFLNSGNSCATVLDRPGKQKCLCNQKYLDSLYKCENELQLCFLGNELDSTFDKGIKSWESLCDSVITFSPTTPPFSAYTEYPDELCAEVKKVCQTAENMINECLEYVSDVDTSSFSSCTCRPELLRLDYSCEYIGNASCLATYLATEAELSNLWGYSGCDNFESVIGTGLPEMSDATLSDLPDLPSSTAVPGVTTRSAPASTSTETSTATHLSSNIVFLVSLTTFIISLCLL